MRDQGMGGDLVYIVSKNAFFAGPNNVAYGASKADQAHQVRLLAAELGQYGIRVNGVNPDGVVRGSGIFAKGWGADRARTYGVPEDKLGEFYAQRTLLKKEVLPEHVAAAVFALVGGDLSPDDRPPHPGRRRGRRRVPAVTGGAVAAVDLGASSGRVVVGRVGDRSLELEEVHRFPNGPGRRRRTACTGTPPRSTRDPGGLRRAASRGRRPRRHRRRRLGRRLRAARCRRRARRRAVPLPRRADRARRRARSTRDRAAGRASTRGPALQFLPFNTIYQLAAERGRRSSRRSERWSSIPDLVGHLADRRPAAEAHERLDDRPARRRRGDVGEGPHRGARPARRRLFAELSRPGRPARAALEPRSPTATGLAGG